MRTRRRRRRRGKVFDFKGSVYSPFTEKVPGLDLLLCTIPLILKMSKDFTEGIYSK